MTVMIDDDDEIHDADSDYGDGECDYGVGKCDGDGECEGSGGVGGDVCGVGGDSKGEAHTFDVLVLVALDKCIYNDAENLLRGRQPSQVSSRPSRPHLASPWASKQRDP